MVIRGVTFDWWGTLAAVPSPQDDAAIRELRIARLVDLWPDKGISVDRVTLYHAYHRQGARLEAAWAQHREPSPAEQVDIFLRFARVNPREPSLVAAVGEAFGGAILDRPPTLFPYVRETLDELRSRGIANGLISNTGRSWGRYLTKLQDAMGIGRCFDVRVYSDEQGTRKPSPKMFEAALQGLGLKSDEVVHVGDDVNADIAIAKGLGMGAIWFNTGFWPNATTDCADAEIRSHRDLLKVLEAWRG